MGTVFCLAILEKSSPRRVPSLSGEIHITGRVDPHLGKVERSLDLILENCHYWDSFVLYSSSSFNNRSHLSMPGTNTSSPGFVLTISEVKYSLLRRGSHRS